MTEQDVEFMQNRFFDAGYTAGYTRKKELKEYLFKIAKDYWNKYVKDSQ